MRTRKGFFQFSSQRQIFTKADNFNTRSSKQNLRTLFQPAGDAFFPKAEIVSGNLKFNNADSFDRALQLGAFYIKIPQAISLQSGKKLCHNFYREKEKDSDLNNAYKGYKSMPLDASYLGYSDRHDQVEQLQLELPTWEKYLAADVCVLLNQMNLLTVKILESVLKQAGVPQSDWETITGGASKNNAWHQCTFNHYRSEKDVPSGITIHKDSGFITTLFADKPGLEAEIDGKCYPIDPQDGYFIVNLGHSLEILTKNLSKPITAITHRVTKMVKSNDELDRYSFTCFIGPRYDMNLYQYNKNGELCFYQTFKDFSMKKAEEMDYEFHPKLR